MFPFFTVSVIHQRKTTSQRKRCTLLSSFVIIIYLLFYSLLNLHLTKINISQWPFYAVNEWSFRTNFLSKCTRAGQSSFLLRFAQKTNKNLLTATWGIKKGKFAWNCLNILLSVLWMQRRRLSGKRLGGHLKKDKIIFQSSSWLVIPLFFQSRQTQQRNGSANCKNL